MDHGTVIEWRVKPGDEVRRGDIVAVVETDKSDIEVETFAPGIVEEIVVPVGQEVAVGAVLARLRGIGEAATVAPRLAEAPAVPPHAIMEAPSALTSAPAPAVLSPIVRRLAEATGVDLSTVRPSGPGGVITRRDVEAAMADGRAAPAGGPPAGARAAGAPQAPTPNGRPREAPRASPRARRLAAAIGVDLSELEGTGPAGAITGGDVERAAAATVAPPAAPLPEAGKPSRGPGSARPILGEPRTPASERQESLRTAVAHLMARSKREIPHYYLTTTIDLSSALGWLEEQNAGRSVQERLLPAALLLKATALAASRVPETNGYWLEDAFRPEAEVHLGVAVSLRGGGLLAPTIRGADQLSVAVLMSQLRDLVLHARSGSLRSGEMSPPTITVTNLGDEGVEAVFPVIYPPQVAMVGFGKITRRPWAADGMLGVHPVVVATLAADHRASDGHRGARFLKVLDELLQRPEAL